MRDTVLVRHVNSQSYNYGSITTGEGMKAVFLVDIGNLYHTIGSRFENKHLDYKKLLAKAHDFGQVERAIAYGSQLGQEATGFIACIKNFGYEVRYKRHQTAPDSRVIVRKAEWDVGIAVDMIRFAGRYNTLILGSVDTDLIPAIQFVRETGVRVVCIGCTIPSEIKELVDIPFEISDELLQEKSHV